MARSTAVALAVVGPVGTCGEIGDVRRHLGLFVRMTPDEALHTGHGGSPELLARHG